MPWGFWWLLLALAAVFLAFPEIDLWVSAQFYRPEEGFFLKHHPAVQFLYRLVPVLSWGLGIAFVGMFALSFFTPRAPRRVAVYLILAMALGPGLFAHTLFKDHWQRPRPSQVMEFGGAESFVRAPLPGMGCAGTCASFVSGHAAMGFFPLVFVPLAARGKRRRAVFAGSMALGLSVGAARIAMGGHFLSDVLFAGMLVYFTSHVLHRLCVRAT